jgi:hypothetical protein
MKLSIAEMLKILTLLVIHLKRDRVRVRRENLAGSYRSGHASRHGGRRSIGWATPFSSPVQHVGRHHGPALLPMADRFPSLPNVTAVFDRMCG